VIDERLCAWLDAHAEALDAETADDDALLRMLATEGLFRIAVPENAGGAGGTTSSAIRVIAQLAEHSLSAAFVCWAQRAVIECMLESPNRTLARELLPRLMDGSMAGAPALSNAMRSLSGFDQLQLHSTHVAGETILNGAVQWATNLHAPGFVIAVAAIPANGGAAVYAIPADVEGVVRECNSDLMALRGTSTGSLRITDVVLSDRWLVHPDAKSFLPTLRPSFLALQCGWGIGLARACLRSARTATTGSPSVLLLEIEQFENAADAYWRQLSDGIDSGTLQRRPADLLRLRLEMIDLATAAVHLELQALGGRAYSRTAGKGFARRWREAAFLSIVTPSMVQLKTELARLRGTRFLTSSP
jgi:alkylation response protein AidB-like acyl-CoA dehydrogenase